MLVATISIFLASPWIVSAQTRVITEDVTRFWEAHDQILKSSDAAEKERLLNALFLDKATPGQLSMLEARRYRPEEYLKAIEAYPRFYASIRANTLRAPEFSAKISTAVERLRTIYPALKPADVYFTVGVFRSGGTVMNGHVLIGVENAMADATTDTSEFPEKLSHLKAHFATSPINDLDFLAVHEFIHTQQPGRWGYDLLSQCVHEGIAEYVTTVALERASLSPAVVYGQANRDKARAIFEQEMFSLWWYRWIWNDTNNPFGMRDMGYAIGYAIAESYYQRSEDKKRAIAELIELNCESREAVERLVERSGYLSKPIEQLRAEFNHRRPTVTGVREFANGSRDVSPDVKTITLNFSEPMDRHYRSTGAGELGLDHFPEVTTVAMAEDGRSFTYSVKLKPPTPTIRWCLRKASAALARYNWSRTRWSSGRRNTSGSRQSALPLAKDGACGTHTARRVRAVAQRHARAQPRACHPTSAYGYLITGSGAGTRGQGEPHSGQRAGPTPSPTGTARSIASPDAETS